MHFKDMILYNIRMAHGIANLMAMIYERRPLKAKTVYVVTLDRYLNDNYLQKLAATQKFYGLSTVPAVAKD